MAAFKLILLFCLLITGCNNLSKKTAETGELKAKHKKKNDFLRVAPEIFLSKVPDSMKKWIPIFREVLADDQRYRIAGYHHITKKEKEEQVSLDAKNLKIVSKYLDQYGWPGLFDVGMFGQQAITMTIQHAPLKIQEKYYPMLVAACKKDPRLNSKLALLEDRINVLNNRRQYYGTQLMGYKGTYVLYPVVNVDSLESFRNQLKLGMPMKDYMKLMKTEWDINEYKRMIPELMKAFKVTDSPSIHLNVSK